MLCGYSYCRIVVTCLAHQGDRECKCTECVWTYEQHKMGHRLTEMAYRPGRVKPYRWTPPVILRGPAHRTPEK